jgi:hypothetical protein
MNKSMALQDPSTTNKRGFFLLWIGINMASWLVWLGVATIPAIAASSTVLLYMALFVIGGGTAVLQWLLLRQRFSIAWYEWIIASAIGFAFGTVASVWTLILDLYIVQTTPADPVVLLWDPLIGGALFGLALGICQAIVWRPRVARMLVWVLVNVVGWSLGQFLPQWIIFILYILRPYHRNMQWLYGLFPVVFAAVVTGIGLLWFLGDQHALDKRT